MSLSCLSLRKDLYLVPLLILLSINALGWLFNNPYFSSELPGLVAFVLFQVVPLLSFRYWVRENFDSLNSFAAANLTLGYAFLHQIVVTVAFFAFIQPLLAGSYGIGGALIFVNVASYYLTIGFAYSYVKKVYRQKEYLVPDKRKHLFLRVVFLTILPVLVLAFLIL